MAKEQEKTLDQKRIAVLLTSILIMKLATQTVAKKSTELRKLVKSFDDLIDDTVHLCMCEVCTDTAYAAIDSDLRQTINTMYIVAKETQQDKHSHGDPNMN